MNALWVLGLVMFWLVVAMVVSAVVVYLFAFLVRGGGAQPAPPMPRDWWGPPLTPGGRVVHAFAWCTICGQRAQEPTSRVCTLCRGEQVNEFEAAVRDDLRRLGEVAG